MLIDNLMLKVDHNADVDFADVLYWMRHAQPGATLPDLIVNPSRPNRVESRAIKRTPKKYDWLNKPRSVIRKTLMARRL